MEIDLTTLPSGARYEDAYGKWLDLFHDVAVGKIQKVTNAPWSWWPLLRYMGAELENGRWHFPHDDLVWGALGLTRPRLDRTAVEVLCGFRPECVDALWKYDMEWIAENKYTPHNERKKEFIVTTNGGFHRPEVMAYLHQVRSYRSPFKYAVLVPCAADKPYPSVLHKAVRARIPAHWGMYVTTGVLGVVPEALWDIAPYYDAGLPNPWRLMNETADFFVRNPHERVVCYTDYNSTVLGRALIEADVPHQFVLPDAPEGQYQDLMSEQNLKQLEEMVAAWDRTPPSSCGTDTP